MSTVPKLTYAKIGKGSKVKAESVSSQLLRSNDQKSNDLFSQMNQQNLNYIKKQLKLKKNRSEHERPRSPEQDSAQVDQQQDEQVTQRYKLYQKYRGEEEVSEKEPHLEETERRSEQGQPVHLVLPEEIVQNFNSPMDFLAERQFISSSHTGIAQDKKQNTWGKMSQSLAYEDGKKRISSIEGYFGEAISANLNMNRQEGLFMQFLEEYICDLNQSKHLKSRQVEEASIQKREHEGNTSQRHQSMSRQGSMPNPSRIEEQIKVNMKKLNRLNRNNDTFGQHNSKYTVKSNQSHSFDQRGYIDFEQKFKEEKLNALLLAQEIDRQRKLLSVKEDIIKKLETDNDLFRQELRHVKIQQEIINKGKKPVPNLAYSGARAENSRSNSRSNRVPNDENQVNFYEPIGSISHIHQRNISNNPHKTAYSYRSSFKHSEDKNLFQPFSNPTVSREKRTKNESGSLQKWQRQYTQFLLDQKKQNARYLKGSKRSREGLV